MVPVQSMASWSERGGFKGLVEWMPIDMVATTLKECIDTRKQILEDIYQITGMSDIIRGMSDPRETATAQQMKGNWGSLRVRDKQKELARFAREQAHGHELGRKVRVRDQERFEVEDRDPVEVWQGRAWACGHDRDLVTVRAGRSK